MHARETLTISHKEAPRPSSLGLHGGTECDAYGKRSDCEPADGPLRPTRILSRCVVIRDVALPGRTHRSVSRTEAWATTADARRAILATRNHAAPSTSNPSPAAVRVTAQRVAGCVEDVIHRHRVPCPLRVHRALERPCQIAAAIRPAALVPDTFSGRDTTQCPSQVLANG